MKNQYFGDVKDYWKYGLIRALSGCGKLETAVCWMLTPDDERSDGGFLQYLAEPERWERFDPELFERLRELVAVQGRREVDGAAESGMLPGARYFTQILTDGKAERAQYFDAFMQLAAGCDLAFFDPDIGLETRSKPKGRAKSSMYLYWDEVTRVFKAGHSVLVYQHFPREKRDTYVPRMVRRLRNRTQATDVYAFRTSSVLFLLAVQERHRAHFRAAAQSVADAWEGQIEVTLHSRAAGETHVEHSVGVEEASPAPKGVVALRSALLTDFRTLHSAPPDWAWAYPPPIPFVGREYELGKSLLIYASAENFAWVFKKPVPSRYTTERAWDRYRAAYEDEGRDSDAFFPIVGMAPIEKGGLLTAARFVAEKLGLPVRDEPRAFLETVAVTNWCKYVIKAEKNEDYVGDIEKLTESLPFVVTELAVLRPAVVLLPHRIWRARSLAAAMRGAAPRTQFLPAPQCNPRVAKDHLGHCEADAKSLRNSLQDTVLGDWVAHIQDFEGTGAWRYLGCLTELLGTETLNSTEVAAEA